MQVGRIQSTLFTLAVAVSIGGCSFAMRPKAPQLQPPSAAAPAPEPTIQIETLVRSSLDAGPTQNLVQMDDMFLEVSGITNATAAGGRIAGVASTGFSWQLNRVPWPNGILAFKFLDQLTPSQNALFFEACNKWAAFTNLTCLTYTNEPLWIEVSSKNNDGCSAQVGAPSSLQGATRMSLGPGCWLRGTIVHEIGHILGLLHEHQRPDRDQYVTVLTQNLIKSSSADIVMIQNAAGTQTPYDFRSVMHYQYNTNSKAPGLDTIIPNDQSLSRGILKTDLGITRTFGWPSDPDEIAVRAIYGARTSALPSPTPSPTPTATASPDVRLPAVFVRDQGMIKNTYYFSPSGGCKMKLWPAGNLIIQNPDNREVWLSPTDGTNATEALLRSDGEFVVRDNTGAVFWQTNTAGRGVRAELRDDCVLYVVNAGNDIVWQSN